MSLVPGLVLARLTVATLASMFPAELSEATGGVSTGKELGEVVEVPGLCSIVWLDQG